MKARFIRELGTRAWLRVYWGGSEWDDALQKSVTRDPCTGRLGCHNAQIHLADSAAFDAWALGGKPEDYPDARWPTACEACGALAPAHAKRQVFRSRIYDTASGNPEPGDLFWARWFHEGPHAGGCEWSNCSGPHLRAVLPNGHPWDVDGRATNCTLRGDKTHRCWVRHGDPEKGELVHVDKNGDTCAAGAGSIAAPGWHGFLRRGEWRSC